MYVTRYTSSHKQSGYKYGTECKYVTKYLKWRYIVMKVVFLCL